MAKRKAVIAAAMALATLIPAAALADRGRYCVPTNRVPIGNVCILVG
jgi:hypothetical protein